MDWSDQIDRFMPLSVEDVPVFAPPVEMKQAVSTYNRALANLHGDSLDIALIALRKLASAYPLFPQPAFLLGCLMAQQGRKEEAARFIHQALSAELPEDLEEAAKECLAYVSVRQPETTDKIQNVPSVSQEPDLPIHAASILEKTKRKSKVKLAGKRERQEVMRRAEFPEEQETYVHVKKEPVEWLRLALPVMACLLLVALLIWAGIHFIPSFKSPSAAENKAEIKLAWLLTQLEQMADKNEDVAALIAEYQSEFDLTPTPVPHLSGDYTDSTGMTQMTAAPTTTIQSSPTPSPSPIAPSPTPTPDPAAVALIEAQSAFDRAKAALPDNLAEAGMALLQAREWLAGIPEETTAEAILGNAAELSEKVEALIDDIAPSAARKLREMAEPLFKQEAYEEALVYYKAAYDLYPRSYNGGVAYYVGRCYQLLDQPEEAKPYFEFVVKNFKGRDIAASAAYRLKEMGY